MAEDRITSDMKSMASSYDTPRAVSLLQDKARDASAYVKDKIGKVQNAREAASDESKSSSGNQVKGATAAAQSIQEGFSGLKDRNTNRHREVIGSMREQTSQLKGISNSVSGVYNMLFKEKYGPDVEPYSREEEGISGLSDQLRRQHEEVMDELKKIRKAVVMGGSGGGGFFGAFGGRPGSRGRRTSRSRTPPPSSRSGTRSGTPPPSSRSGTPPPTPNQNRSSSSWGRAAANGGGGPPPPPSGGNSWLNRAQNLGNSKYARIISGVVTGATAAYTGIKMLGGNDSPDISELGSSGTPSSSPASSPAAQSTGSSYSGLGSVSAGEESRQGVHTISTGVGDHGGVSYGTHQLATENGSMAAFLRSEEGQPYAPAFQGMQPGTNAFNARYSEVAKAHEKDFAAAQKNYIFRTHYAPMLNNVKRGSGFDATNRGPAVHEMLYSTGVQYGGGTSVINNALKGYDPNNMTDADIIRRVQEYKGQTVGQYFRSSAPDTQRSVYRRTFRERDTLLAMDAEYQQQLAAGGQPASQENTAQVASTQTGNSPVSANTVAQEEPVSLGSPPQQQPEQVASNNSNTAIDAATVALTAGAAGSAALSLVPARSTPTPAVPPSVTPAAASGANANRVISATPATPRSITATPPPSIAAPTPTPTPPSTGAAPRSGAPAAPPPTGGGSTSIAGKAVQGLKKAPVLSLGFAALDTATVLSNEELSTGEKAGEITDIAGATTGGIVGAKVGASFGLLGGPLAPVTVPLGGLVGGFLGYMGGKKATNSARNFAGEMLTDEEGEVEENVPITGAEVAASSPSTEEDGLPSNHPMMVAQRNIQREAENSADTLEDAQTGNSVQVGTTSSASETAQTLAAAESSQLITKDAFDAAVAVGSQDSTSPTVVNNFPVQGESATPQNEPSTGTPTPAQTNAPQVSQAPSAPRPEVSARPIQDTVGLRDDMERPSLVADAAFTAMSGILSTVGIDTDALRNASTRREAPEHMRKNLHGYAESTAPAVTSRTQNRQTPDVYSPTVSTSQSDDQPARVQEEEEEAAAPTRPTTVREGNRVSHDFTQNIPTTSTPSTGSEITDEDLTTRPVGSSNAPSFRPQDQINLDINEAHARMNIRPMGARQAASTPKFTPQRGQTAPAEGTAPDFMSSVGYNGSSMVSSVAGQNQSNASPSSDVSTQTVSDVPAQRQQFDSVQKVMMMEPPTQAREKPDNAPQGRTPSTGTYEPRNHQPSIDETPALVSDFGLTLLNTGFI